METSPNLIGTPITVTFFPQSGAEDSPVTVQLSEDAVFVTGIRFNGTPVASFTPNGDGTFSTRVPRGATTGRVKVTLFGGATLTSSQNFVVNNTNLNPTITRIDPLMGGIGTMVTVTGTNLGNTFNAFIGSSEASVRSVSPTSVRIEVIGTGSGRVSLQSESGTVSSSESFTYVQGGGGGGGAGLPQIDSFNPVSGGTGTPVTIRGTGFSTLMEVTFNGRAASTQPGTDTEFIAFVPANATTGKISVRNSAGTTLSAGNFQVTTQATLPSITSFNPTMGAFPLEIQIDGGNLGNVSMVKFNGQTASFRLDTSSRLFATVPPNASTGPIQVINPAGSATSQLNFSVINSGDDGRPAIDNFTPAMGPVGTDVTINGRNFSGAVLSLGGQSIVPSSISNTQIRFRVPSGAISGRITVSTRNGSATSGQPFEVTATNDTRPAIDNFTPLGGAVDVDVTVNGRNFLGATVTLAGQPVQLTSITATQLQFKVPSGAMSGFIVVTTTAGTATSAQEFSVMAVEPPPLALAGQLMALPQEVQALATQFDNERPPAYTGFPSGLVGLLDLVSGQSYQILLVATRSDNEFDSVVVSVTPIVLTEFTFGTPTPVPAGSPFSFDIATETSLQNGLYDFGVSGRGQIGDMLEYLPFGLTVNVRAPLEFLLPQSIMVVPGQTTTTRIRVVRRRAPRTNMLTVNAASSNLPAGFDVSFTHAGFTNNLPEDAGGVIDNYDLAISAPPAQAAGNFNLVIANPSPGFFVQNEMQAITVQVKPVEVVLERLEVSSTDVRPLGTFDIRFDLISKGYEGKAFVKVVSITNEDGTAAQINKQGFNPEEFTLTPTTQLSAVPFSFFVDQQCTSGTKTINLELKYMVNGMARTMTAMATIIVSGDRVVLTPDNLDFSIFDTEERNFGIDVERINGFGEAFIINLSFPDSKINVSPNPIMVSNSSIREVVRIKGKQAGQSNNEVLQFNPAPNGSPLQLPILIRTTTNFLGFSASGYSLSYEMDVPATVKVNPTGPNVLGQSDDIDITFQIVNADNVDVTSLFIVNPTGPQSINNFNREVKVNLRKGKRVPVSSYRIVANGTFGTFRSAPKFKAEATLTL